MLGRPKDPTTQYKVLLHQQSNGYRYAATMQYVCNEKGQIVKRKYVYWGSVTEDFRFIPNLRYNNASLEERDHLIFPANWDLSEIKKVDLVNTQKYLLDPNITNDDTSFTGIVATSNQEEQFCNQLYGVNWFLWRLLVKNHIVEDLIEIFRGDQILVNDLISLVMFSLINKSDFEQVSMLQKYMKFPCNHFLSKDAINSLSKKIDSTHLLSFQHKRLSRQNHKDLIICNSTITNQVSIFNGVSVKRSQYVVYAAKTYEPIYIDLFDNLGNPQLDLYHIEDLLKISSNASLCLIDEQPDFNQHLLIDLLVQNKPFLMNLSLDNEIVLNQLDLIKFNSEGLPINMDYDPQTKLYFFHGMYNYSYQVDHDQEAIAELKVNLLLDMQRRINDLIYINEKIEQETKELYKFVDQHKLSQDPLIIKELNNSLSFHYIAVDHHTLACSIFIDHDRIGKAKTIAGFKASLTANLERNAKDYYQRALVCREQLMYFDEHKNLWATKHPAFYSTYELNLRTFVLLIGLMLRTKIKAVWKEKLTLDYKSWIDVVYEMYPIRLITNKDHNESITEFTDQQKKICHAFEIPFPQCEPNNLQRTRKRGRPKGAINKNKKL